MVVEHCLQSDFEFLIFSSYSKLTLLSKLLLHLNALLSVVMRLNGADNEGSNCLTRPPLPKAKSQKTNVALQLEVITLTLVYLNSSSQLVEAFCQKLGDCADGPHRELRLAPLL